MTSAAATSTDCPFSLAGKDVYNRADFEAIARLTHEASGIVLPQGKAMLVYSRLARRLRERRITRFADYVSLIRRDEAERLRAVTLLTTNHTLFFREEHHFEHFATQVRPDLVRRLGSGERVRLWSAGCSSGEEVYSLAMTLLGPDRTEGKRLAAADLAILASDLSDDVVARGTGGVYPIEAVEPVPAPLRSAWIEEGRDGATIAETVRALVRFRRLNLLAEWPFSGPFDVIFCRNVMIYFDEPTKAALIARFVQMLPVGGHLYIGHSERAIGPEAAKLTLVGNTAYRKDRP